MGFKRQKNNFGYYIGASKVSHITDAVDIQNNLEFYSEELNAIKTILKT